MNISHTHLNMFTMKNIVALAQGSVVSHALLCLAHPFSYASVLVSFDPFVSNIIFDLVDPIRILTIEPSYTTDIAML